MAAECRRQLPHLKRHWISPYKQDDRGQWRPTAEEVIATVERVGAAGFGSLAKPEHFDGAFVEKLVRRHQGVSCVDRRRPRSCAVLPSVGCLGHHDQSTAIHSRAIGGELTSEKWPIGVFASIDEGLGGTERGARTRREDVSLAHTEAGIVNARVAREFRRQLTDLGITVTCVFGGFAGESYADIPTVKATVGLVPPATRAERTHEMKEIADFALALGVNVVGVHIGFVPHDKNDPDYAAIIAVARELSDHFAPTGRPCTWKPVRNRPTCCSVSCKTWTATTYS